MSESAESHDAPTCRDCALVGYHCGQCGCCKPDLGWWAISGEVFLDALRRTHAGEDPDLIYAEVYANSDVSNPPENAPENGGCHCGAPGTTSQISGRIIVHRPEGCRTEAVSPPAEDSR